MLTSSEKQMGDLKVLVSKQLQSLCERSSEQILGDDGLNLEEILRGGIIVIEDSRGNVNTLRSEVTRGNDLETSDLRGSHSANVDRNLREELDSLNVTTTPVRAVWPIYIKRRGSFVEERDAPTCKSVMFAGSDKGADVSRGYAVDVCEGMPESNITIGGFFVLERIARKQDDEGAVRSHAVTGGDGVVSTYSPSWRIVWTRGKWSREVKVLS